MDNNSKNNDDNTSRFRRLSRAEAFLAEQGPRVEAFLDRHGYTAREVRGIAKRVIALWETQPAL